MAAAGSVLCRLLPVYTYIYNHPDLPHLAHLPRASLAASLPHSPPPLHTMGASMCMRDAILERACVIDIRAGANLNRTVHGPRSSSSLLVMIPPPPSPARRPTYLGVWLTALTPLTMN